MKANELRIGNLVTIDEEVLVVENISKRKIVANSANWDVNYLKPIPLTEEILLKFGGKVFNKEFKTFDFDKLSIYLPSKHYQNGRSYYNSWCIMEKSPEYVHQLQNIFFALTNEELIWKS